MKRLGVRCLALALILALALSGCAEVPREVRVPVLMYHHLAKEGSGSTVISVDKFRQQMELLDRKGYTPVSIEQLTAYADDGKALPEKPVCITFDDGYYSNYESAWPILRELGFHATIFVIGSSVGHREFYKDTQYALIPHFGTEEIREMTASGLIAVQSHGYDMHQNAAYEDTDRPRTSMLPLEGETDEEYRAALTEDSRLEEQVLAQAGVNAVTALAYPLGQRTDVTEEVLSGLGVRVTFTVDSTKENLVVRGEPETLLGMGRLGVGESTTDQELLEYLQRQ